MDLEGTYKAIESNPLLNAGVQIKDLTGGCPVFLNTSSIGAHLLLN